LRSAGTIALVPAGRPPKPLTPTASKAAALGAELRELRGVRGLTLQVLARRIGYSTQHVSDAEHGRTAMSQDFVASVDLALGADGRLLDRYPAVLIERATAREKRASERRSAATVDDDVKRRAFIGLGLAVVLLGPEAAARALSEADAERIAHEWSIEIATAPDRRALLPGLAADLKRLVASGSSQHAVAQLSSYVAMIAVSSGDAALARRWWLRARRAADAAGDPHLTAYVAGQHAVQGIYGLYAPAQALRLADDALAITRAPCAGGMSALGARALALSMLGRKRDARAAIADVEKAFERLPRDITRNKIAAGGWAEERLHHTRSYCAMYGGDGGDSARADALRLYVDADWRSRAQIKLHRAASEADAHDAVATLSALSDAQRRDRFVRMIAARALAVCERERVAGIAELRDVLSVA
jgi:transcriptional regulator with XRE-family HTH domain